MIARYLLLLFVRLEALFVGVMRNRSFTIRSAALGMCCDPAQQSHSYAISVSVSCEYEGVFYLVHSRDGKNSPPGTSISDSRSVRNPYLKHSASCCRVVSVGVHVYCSLMEIIDLRMHSKVTERNAPLRGR